ncbi:MAG: radical SAM family heme chaperone HemW [Rickettsiales bacterium]|nr:radical SAM family heme chaperone HemW [Rickettsiales bacterium]
MFGIYFHWPFCLSKCVYCDFGSIVVDKEKFSLDFQNTYAECCKRQLLYFKSKIQLTNDNEKVSSIYFGGGTPSLIDVNVVKDLILFVKQEFNVEHNCEITIEANPTSCCYEKFEQLNRCGVNRISIGVQSFDDIELSFLGRKHSSKEAIKTIENAKKVFPKWSIDLIYGLPRQNINKWLQELQFAIEFQPQHLSLYTLIVENNTLLGKMVENGVVIPKNNDELGEFYIATNDFIKNTYQKTKIRQYEVSNYSIKGYESRHNLAYWKYYDYIGIGAGAHGRMNYLNTNTRFETICVCNPNEWMECVMNGRNGLITENPLSTKEIAEEIIMMGLRTIYGINILDIKKRFNLNIMEFIEIKLLQKLMEANILSFENGGMVATNQGLPVIDGFIYKIIK